ncbi:MAG: lipocalin family protein [Pricia sp.]
MKLTLTLLAILLLSTSCDKMSSGPIDADELSIAGTWTLTEAYISAGGPQYWIDVEDGEEITFFDDGTFTSNRFTECETGNFSITGDELLLEYDCEGFELPSQNDKGPISYTLEFFSDYFILTPTSGPICIEGCSYKYEK